ncbi:unnamed protein product [Meganyctiphanes norvegica]|uniref:C3H1-type domain-containing protein n=1 Tax=Meganyctiphanes norvegica TaxID=48144 RepID=A0AAV2QBA3_MEGNR
MSDDKAKPVMAPIAIEACGGGGQSGLIVSINPHEEHKRMEEAFQDIIRKAPKSTIELGQSVTDCLSVYNIRHAFDRLNVEKIKMFPHSVLETTAAYLQIIVGSRKLDIKRVQNREDLASIIVSQIQNHLPEVCIECGQTYTVQVGEERSRHCYGCGQGSHDCYKNQKSEEDQHFIEVRYRYAYDVGFVWLCTHHAKLFFDLETSVNKEAMRNLPARKYSPMTPKPDIVDYQCNTSSITRGLTGMTGMTSLRERELGYPGYDQFDRYQIVPGNTELTKQRLLDAERNRTQEIMLKAEDHRRRAEDMMRRDDLQRAGDMYLRSSSDRPNLSNEVCRHYKMGRCKHGPSGIINGACPFLHPPQCLKYVTYGTTPGLGCNKGLYCENLHAEASQSYLRGAGAPMESRMVNYPFASNRSPRRLPELPHMPTTDPLLVPRIQVSDQYLLPHSQSVDPYLSTSHMQRSDPYLLHDPIERKQIMLQQRQDSLETTLNEICSTLTGYEPRLRTSPVHMDMQPRHYASDIQPQVYTQRMYGQDLQPRMYSSDLQPRMYSTTHQQQPRLYSTAQQQQPRMIAPDLQTGMYASSLQPRMHQSMVAPELHQQVMYNSSLQQPMNAAANMQHTRMATTNMHQPMMTNVSMPMNTVTMQPANTSNMQQMSTNNPQQMNVSNMPQQQQPMTSMVQQPMATNQQQMATNQQPMNTANMQQQPRIQVQPVTPTEVQQQPVQQSQQQSGL